MTKAKTQAQKIKAKRGRPTLPHAEREPNGRASRRKLSVQKHSEENIMNVAVSRRINQLGLVDNKVETAVKQAIDPRRGYVLGLLWLDGQITERQHEAGIRFANDMARYYGLTQVPFPSARAQDLFAIRSDGEVSQGQIDAAKIARARMVKLRDVLLSVGDINTGRRVLHTVMNIAVLDIEQSRRWPEHMLAWLRRGLNKLADYYVLGEA